MIITISGNPGSGKSTVAKIIAQKLNLKHYSTGDFMREMALKRKISLAELGKIAEKDRRVDEELDNWQVNLGKTEDNFVIDARIGFHFIPKSIKIFLSADLKTRAERILKDIEVKKLRKEETVKDINDAMRQMKEREGSETARYLKYYNVNPYDQKYYDLVVDTTKITAEQAAEKIIDFINKHKNKRGN